jgi:hypothetical protein
VFLVAGEVDPEQLAEERVGVLGVVVGVVAGAAVTQAEPELAVAVDQQVTPVVVGEGLLLGEQHLAGVGLHGGAVVAVGHVVGRHDAGAVGVGVAHVQGGAVGGERHAEEAPLGFGGGEVGEVQHGIPVGRERSVVVHREPPHEAGPLRHPEVVVARPGQEHDRLVEHGHLRGLDGAHLGGGTGRAVAGARRGRTGRGRAATTGLARPVVVAAGRRAEQQEGDDHPRHETTGSCWQGGGCGHRLLPDGWAARAGGCR